MIKVKSLTLFYLAAASLAMSGFVVNNDQNWMRLITAIWSSVSGVFLIYRFNDYIDERLGYQFKFKLFFREHFNLFMLVQFVLINVPLAIIYFPTWYLLLFVFVGLFGFMYSIVWKFKGKKFRLKNAFLFKNFLIGSLWGCLILLGAGSLTWSIMALFVFTSVQVFIGSIIRDLTDANEDEQNSVRSLPVIFGRNEAILALHLTNLFSLLAAVLVAWELEFVYFCLTVVAWRFINLIGVQSRNLATFWTETMNLLTCCVILLTLLLQNNNGLF